MDEPLLARSKLSMVYGVNEYEEMLRTKMSESSEIAQLKAMSPDEEGPKASGEAGSVLKSGTEADGKSKKGKREFPTPNKPDPMPRELEFLFTRISPEQMLYMWNVYTALFCAQCASVLAYCFMLSQDVNWYLATAAFSVPMAALMIQNVYILHDVLHGATFPPYDWQKYITHCWADQFSLPWEELVLEHQRHHASTVDLLVHGEFGWDPATWLYVLQEWTDKWYGWLTVPLVPVWHWIGANDTGALFSLLWYANFPDQGAGGKCNKDFWGKWVPNRLRHCLFVASLWSCVWLLGTWPLGRPLSEGWRFFLPVTNWLHHRLDVLHQFQPFPLVERVLGRESDPQLPRAQQGHGLLVGWQTSFQRDALPWLAPRLPQRCRRIESAWPFSWLGKGAWCRSGCAEPWSFLAARWGQSGATHAEASEEAFLDEGRCGAQALEQLIGILRQPKCGAPHFHQNLGPEVGTCNFLPFELWKPKSSPMYRLWPANVGPNKAIYRGSGRDGWKPFKKLWQTFVPYSTSQKGVDHTAWFFVSKICICNSKCCASFMRNDTFEKTCASCANLAELHESICRIDFQMTRLQITKRRQHHQGFLKISLLLCIVYKYIYIYKQNN